MNPSIQQAGHNDRFHNSICEQSPETFFDWKITCLFYCSYHLIQALAAHRKISLGDRHSSILWNMNPKNAKRTLKVKDNIFKAFDSLFELSRLARYDGFTDFDTFQLLKKADYAHAKKAHDYIKKYVQEQGVQLNY